MRIRPAEASDAEAIEALFHEFVAHLRALGDDGDYRFSAKQLSLGPRSLTGETWKHSAIDVASHSVVFVSNTTNEG